MLEGAHAGQAIVYVVDDEPSIRNSTKELAESVGLRVQTFATAQDFLGSERPNVPGCLVLDVRLPGLSGLDLQREVWPTEEYELVRSLVDTTLPEDDLFAGAREKVQV